MRYCVPAFSLNTHYEYVIKHATDLPLDFVSSASPLKVCRLMTHLPVLIGAIVMLI